jgi:hypothetical protein
VLFRRSFALSVRTLEALVAAGLAAPGADPAVRAAFLLSNDLAVLLLREQLTEALGTDPPSRGGHGPVRPGNARHLRRRAPGLISLT